MKKTILSFLLLSMLTVVAFAAKQTNYALYEGFEDGTIPASWTQEFVVGHTEWIVESDAVMTYPTGAFAGEYAAALRNTTGQTQHYVTRLVSPAIDLSGIAEPIVVFSHAQAQRTGDIDTLRVFYRTSPNAQWRLLKQFDSKITTWQTDTLMLPAASSNYQICFEGNDNYGRGIVLDEIIVRAMPTCTAPANFTTTTLTSDSAVFVWAGSFDTDSFHVVLSTKEITDISNPVGVVLDTFVYDFSCAIGSLKRNTKYYVYLQANCGNELSEWAGFTFSTKNIANLPYEQTFNLPYASGTVSHVSYWSYGTSITKDDGSMEYMPFVNQNTAESSLKNYSQSATTCLVFSGARSVSTAIPVGQYVYAATPEMNTSDIRNCEVRFWGSSYNYFGEDYKSALLVGVMTDPQDVSTFEVVDTVYAVADRTFGYYVVSFDSYQGTGKYVGFMSRFSDKKNIFYLDDVTVLEREAVSMAAVPEISAITPESFVVNGSAAGAATYNIKVVRDTTIKTYTDPSEVPAELNVTEATGVTLPYTLNLPAGKNGCFLQVYVQGVNGTVKGDWSLPKKVQVPMGLTDDDMPYTITFDEANMWQINQLDNFSVTTGSYKYPWSVLTRAQENGDAPYVYTSYGETQQGIALKRKKAINADGTIRFEQEQGDYLAFAAVADVKNVILRFSARAYSATAINAAGLRVGVMTDPLDPSTFVVVDSITPIEAYQSYLVSFGNYAGAGRYVAIQTADGTEMYKVSTTTGSGGSYTTYYTSYNCLDNVTLMSLSGCAVATGAKANTIDTVADLTWQANGQTAWQLFAFADAALKDTLVDTLVSAPSFHLEGLKAHTTYYWQVNTLCSTDTVEGLVNRFTTSCAVNGEKLPYVESFETYEASSTIRQLPACWNGNIVAYYPPSGEGSTSYYPYIGKSSGYAKIGSQYLLWGHPSTATAMYFALPVMSEPVSNLQMSLWILPAVNSYKDTLLVGVMTDPTDLSTFTTVDSLPVSGSGYAEHIISFGSYTGQGEYIAVRKPLNKHYYYIDDIRVAPIADCAKIQKVTTSNANTHGVTINWTDANAAPQYEVMITGAEVVPDTVTVALIDTIFPTAQSIVIYDTAHLDINVSYYVYVRALCSASSASDWSNPVSFRTQCTPNTIEDANEDFSDPSTINCWVLGAFQGTNLPTSTSGYLYMYTPKTGDGSYAIMPPLDIDSIKHYQMSFKAHGGTSITAGRKLAVGVITNLSDFSSYEPVQQFDLPIVSSNAKADNYGFNEALTYTVRFDKYDGDYVGEYGKNVMFLAQNGEVLSYAYIDDIVFEELGSCYEPLELTADSVGSDWANLSWQGEAEATYQLRLYDKQMTEAGANVLLDTIISGNRAAVTNLQMLHTYYMYARTICGAGDTSRWSNWRKFMTECPAVMSLPYSEDFDGYTPRTSVPYDEPNCWNAWYNGIAGTETSTYARLYATAKMGTTGNGYYMGSYMYKSTTADTVFRDSYAVLPAIDADLSTTMISFYAKATSTTGTRLLTVGVADFNEPLDSVMNYTPLHTFEIAGTTFQYFSAQLSDYAGTGKHIVLHMHHGQGTSNSSAVYLYLDNLKVEAMPSCFTPVSVQATAVGKSAVRLAWTPQGKEKAWDIACVEKDSAITDATTILHADSAVFTVTGLNPSTQYDFYVRANCGSDDVSAWSEKATCQTLCIVDVENAHWDFEDHSEMSVVKYATSTSYVNYSCWMGDYLNGSSYSYVPYVNPVTAPESITETTAFYGYRSTYSLRLYSTAANKPVYAVMPELNASLDTLQLRFKATAAYISNRKTGAIYSNYAKGTYQHAIKVGVMTDPTDISTFEQLAEYVFPEVTAANCTTLVDSFAFWNEYTVPLYGASGKFIAFVSDYDATNYAYIDDVVVEKEAGCAAPSKLMADSLEATSAILRWGSSKAQWDVVLAAGTDTLVDTIVVAKPALPVSLNGNTDYTLSVRAYCDGSELSAWSSFDFHTPCVAFDSTEAKWNFAEGNAPYMTGSSLVLPQCWTGGQLTRKASSPALTYIPQAIANTAACQYGRTEGTSDRALRFYNYISGTTTEYSGSYVILPELNVNYDSTALHFWYRAAYFYTPTYTTTLANRNKLYAANNNYPKDLVIGVITDPEDMTTFRPINTLTYNALVASSTTNVFATNDPTGNYYWQEAVIPLEEFAEGRVVLYYTGSATGYMFVDDIEVVSAQFCTAPSAINVENLASNAATLRWTMLSDSADLHVSTSAEFTDTVAYARLDTTAYALTNLTPATNYYYRLRSICSADEQSDWTEGAFTTLYAIRFAEDFAEVRTYPKNWVRASSKVDDVFNSGIKPAPLTSETAVSWTRGPVDGDIYVSTGTGTGTGTTTTVTQYHYWLITPVIDLVNRPAGDSLMLSFKLRLTNNSNQLPFNQPAPDDQFIVAVSTDGGQTYTRSNATIWGFDTDADRSYADITAEAKTIRIDMSKFVGNNITIAFVQNSLTTSGKPSSKNYLHIDDISLNRFALTEYDASICRWNDYVDANFAVDADDLVVGATTTYERFTPAKAADQLTIMNLTVNSDTTVHYQATVCEGTDFADYGFTVVNATKSMVYKKKLEGANTCDSIVSLTLTVLPKLYETVEAHICQGEYYEFNGVRYYTNTIHTDTISSVVTGCDSIVTLHLTVSPAVSGESTILICHGASYPFGKWGNINKPGTYVDTLVSAAGCDSVATLHLKIADTDTTFRDTIEVTELPYVLNGVEYLPLGTEEGEHQFWVELKGCGLITATVQVGRTTALHSLAASAITVAPSPASVGEPIRVYGDVELADVEVVNASGTLVYRAEHLTAPIVLPGMPAAGVYLITVRTATGIHMAKLIVK